MAFYAATMIPATGNLPSLFGFGNAIQKSVYDAIEAMARKWHHYGETNRYSKEPIEVSDGPPFEKSFALGSLQYQPYQYIPLYHNDEEVVKRPVRLLELFPPVTAKNDLIRCKLHTYSLDKGSPQKAPEYEAISYAWGVVNTRDFPVIVVTAASDDTLEFEVVEVVNITRHLYAALSRLRHPTQSRFLWADQICIDQDNKPEKGKQVKQMGAIYKNSKRTMVWLGEEDWDKDVIVEMFDLLKHSPYTSLTDDLNMFKGFLDLEEFVFTTPDQISRKQWRRQAVTRLLNRTWFSRVWVFQEAVVSPRVEIKYGSLEFSLEELFRLSRAVFEVENAAGGYARSIAKRSNGFDTLYMIQHSRPGGCGDSTCPREQVSPNFLGLVMQVLQQLQATKEHDLIFAFIGFDIPKPPPGINVDYKQPVRTVWVNSARNIIQDSRSLDIFAAARGDEKCKFDLPSWVPDFSRCYPYARPITAPDFKTAFEASGGWPHVWEEPVDSDILIVKGKVVGTIMWLSPLNFNLRFHRDDPKGTKTVLDYEKHADILARTLDIQGIVTPQRREELLVGYRTVVRTLLADGAFGHKQPLEYQMDEIIYACENEDQIQAAFDAPPSMFIDKTQTMRQYEILEKVREWGLIVQQKRLFLSDRHDIGLVPRTAVESDLICLLHGSKVPCVLRRISAGEEKYRIISQCYLDRMMNCNGSAERTSWMGKDCRQFVLV